MRRLFVIFILLFNVQTVFAEEEDFLCQFKVSLAMCFEESSEAGFVSAKAAMETYKENSEIVLLLKEAACYCTVSGKFKNEMIKFADDVIKMSPRASAIAVAWYQKSHISCCRCEDENALLYSEIALNTLKKVEDQAKEGCVSFRELYEGLCHMTRMMVFEDQGNEEMKAKEEAIIKSKYKWMNGE